MAKLAVAATTTTEQVFVPGHLSWLSLDPGQKVAFVPGLTASRASRGIGAFCPGWWLHPGQKAPFVPVGVTNPDKRPLHVIVQKEVILY